MGKVYIVGAGPGDPDLLTIKALKAIEKADVILYDRLVNKEILQYAKEQADLIYCGKLASCGFLAASFASFNVCSVFVFVSINLKPP